MLEAKTSTEVFFMTRDDSDAVAPANESFADASGSGSAVVERLVRSATSGDRQAFDGLYQIYAPLVHGVLLARVPYGEVSDLAQDVFLVAFRKLGSLRDCARFGPWLAMIARNRATDFHRRRRETEDLSEGIAQVFAPPTAEAEEALEMIRSLPEAYRETLVLRLVEGMTGPEIAERTGLQPESVRVNLHRGMKLLREKLGVKGREV